MSQVATARPLGRPAARPRPTARDLRVVTAPRAGHGGLLLVCLLSLVAALLAVLLLNIAMAKSTFALGQLQRESSELADSAAEAQHALDRETAPAALAQKALDLGMVPSGSAAFLRLRDGAVLGVAQAAPETSTFSVVAQAPELDRPRTVAPTPAPVPSGGTTVRQEGTITRTTVVEITDATVVTTVTSADSATGITTTTTTSTALPAVTQPTGTASAGATATPSPSLEPSPAPSPTP